MKLYGEELKKSIMETKQRMIDALDRRDERIRNWETDEDDCFMSIRVEQQAISECNKQLAILNGDGMMDFEATFDKEGNEVRVRYVRTRFGDAYVVDVPSDEPGHKWKPVFASSMKALLKKTGYTQKTIRVPAWTKFCSGPGGGLCGVYSGSYETVRWHTNMLTGEYVGYPD